MFAQFKLVILSLNLSDGFSLAWKVCWKYQFLESNKDRKNSVLKSNEWTYQLIARWLNSNFFRHGVCYSNWGNGNWRWKTKKRCQNCRLWWNSKEYTWWKVNIRTFLNTCSFFLAIIVDWIWPKKLETEKSDELLSLRANLTLIEPNFGPWGALHNPKSGFNLEVFLRFYSRVHISSDKAFFKILKKPSIM